jgi:hypothetical protein
MSKRRSFSSLFQGSTRHRYPPLAKFRTGWVEELAADGNEDKNLAEHSCSAQLCID